MKLSTLHGRSQSATFSRGDLVFHWGKEIFAVEIGLLLTHLHPPGHKKLIPTFL